MDYYSILGVQRNATPEDLKKAYRKLAMANHPDRTGGDDTKFKQINEAYNALKDPATRQQYDNPQHRFDTSHMHNSGNYQDIFNSMFGAGFAQPQQQRRKNADVRIKVDISLKEVYTGKKIIAAYRLRSGREENVDLDIPKGAGDNDTIRFQGLGDDSFPVTRGDLYVIISIHDELGWTRNNDNLITTRKVNCLELILGTRIQIETLDDKTLELNIPAGTKNGTTFSMQDYGLPNIRTNRRGNMLIKIEADIPKNLTHEQLSKISEIVYGT
jgi:curved DNA-binding protein|tara:strand:- start:2142 stop:2954 length:813 start_codon:yes stop_codon:yes gene_type:complete